MKTETVCIGEFTYQITQVPASVGLRVASRLANALADSVKALPEEGFEMSEVQIASFLAPLLANPNLGDTLDWLCKTFAEKTLLSWQEPNESEPRSVPLSRRFDDHFADRYDDMIMWLVASLRVSMSSFFRGVRGLGALVPRTAKAAPASQSQS